MLSINGAQINFKLQGSCVRLKSPIVAISISSRVSQIKRVDKIKYRGIPLAIPIKKTKDNFFEK